MYRVIKASRYDDWEDQKYELRERCVEAYNKAITSDQLEDMDYGQLITFVADHANVAMNIAGYFVDEFMRDEPEPLPLRAASE